MSVNDITFYEPGAFSVIGTRRYQVNASSTVINPGEPVYITGFNQNYVLPFPTSAPTLALGYVVGIAQSTSTNTASVAGVVDVFPAVPGVIYYATPNNASTYGVGSTPNQGTYNALVGRRVLFDLTAGAYTILSTDNAANGLVVENVDVTKSSGKVAFSFRNAWTYLGAS